MRRLLFIGFIFCAGVISAQTIMSRTKTTTAGDDSTMFIIDRGDGGTILTRRWHWLDMMTQAAGNGLSRSGNGLVVNPGLGIFIGTDAVNILTDSSYGLCFDSGNLAVALKPTGSGLYKSATGIGIYLGGNNGLIVNGSNELSVNCDADGLEIYYSKVRVKTDADSAMGITPAGDLYPVIDHDRGMFYSSGKMALYIDTGRNLSFGADGKVGLSPRFEIYGNSLYFEVSAGVYKAIKLNNSEGPY